MSDTILKVNYDVSKEALYEIETSNKVHFDKIKELVADAKADLSGVEGVGGVTALLEYLPDDIAAESKRYTDFAPAFTAFVNAVASIDAALETAMGQSIDDNYVNKDLAAIKEFVNQNTMQASLIDLAGLLNLGLTEIEISNLLAVTDILNQCKGLSREEIITLLKQTAENLQEEGDSVLAKIIKDLHDGYLKDPQTIALNVLDGNQDYLVTLLNKMHPNITSAERATALANLASLNEKLSAIDLKLANNKYIKPGGRTYYKKDLLLRNIAKNQEVLDKLDDMDRKLLEKITLRNKWIIGGAIVAVQLAVDLYDDMVVTGFDWDDASEKLITNAAGIGIGITVDAGLGYVVTAALPASWAGPAGVAVAIVAIGAVTAYNVWLKEPFETWIEEQKDGWQQLWW